MISSLGSHRDNCLSASISQSVTNSTQPAWIHRLCFNFFPWENPGINTDEQINSYYFGLLSAMVVQSFTVPVIISPAHCTPAVLLKVHCSAPVARQSVSEDSFPMHLKKNTKWKWVVHAKWMWWYSISSCTCAKFNNNIWYNEIRVKFIIPVAGNPNCRHTTKLFR